MSLLPLIPSGRKDHMWTLLVSLEKTSLAKLILTGCQMSKSYTTKRKNPTQTENAINGEASQTEDREKVSQQGHPCCKASPTRHSCALQYPALIEANTNL